MTYFSVATCLYFLTFFFCPCVLPGLETYARFQRRIFFHYEILDADFWLNSVYYCGGKGCITTSLRVDDML